jgi:Tfp pilus assembly protein PilN
MNWWWIGGIAFLVGLLYIFAPLGICWFTLRRNKLDEIPSPLQQIVRRFEWRASNRQCGSHAILALILGLLAAAAWVFVQAKEITTQETGGDLSQKLNQRTEKRNADLRELDRLRNELTAGVKPIIDMIGQAV